ncbi:MAG: glycosyltransferase [Patescibacteria group bacterium]
MRIAILTNAFPPLSRGGAGRIAGMQADWLVRHGHEVKVFVPAPFPVEAGIAPFETFVTRTSIPFAKLNKTIAPMRLMFHLEDLAPNLKAVDQIRAWEPDVLLTHNLTGCGWGTPKMLQATGVRWIHVLHDVQMFEPSGQMMSYNVQRTAYNVVRMVRGAWYGFWSARRSKALGSPDVVISPSQWLLEEHRRHELLTDVKTQVLPNPVEIPRGFCENEMRDEPKIIYIGRLSDDKGVNILIDAWQSLNPRPGILTLVGDGELTSKLNKLNDATIVLKGQLSHEQAMEELYASRLLILPSLVMENQPTVLLEAVAAGINVVAADVGGVRELLQGYGAIVPPGNVKALADAIRQTLNQQTQTQIREKILARHNVDEEMGKLVEELTIKN